MQLSELAHTRPSLPGLPCTSPRSPPTCPAWTETGSLLCSLGFRSQRLTADGSEVGVLQLGMSQLRALVPSRNPKLMERRADQ